MMNVSSRLARRVSISHGHGRLLVRIARRNKWPYYVWGLLMGTGCFVGFCSVTSKAFFHRGAPEEIGYGLLLVVIATIGYMIVLAMAIWGLFGEEEILVENGMLQWKCKALRWVSSLEVATHEISAIEAIKPWHGFKNRVEVTAQGRTYRIGEEILRDDATDLARELKRAVVLR